MQKSILKRSFLALNNGSSQKKSKSLEVEAPSASPPMVSVVVEEEKAALAKKK